MSLFLRALCTSLLVSCSTTTSPPPPPGDAGGIDAVVGDSGTDVPSDVPTDATEGDTATDSGSALSCQSEIFELIVDPVARERVISSVATSRGFAFGWGDSMDVREQARTAEIARDSSAPIVRPLTDDERSARSVRISEGYAIWIDDGGNAEHHVIRGTDTRTTESAYRTLSASEGEHTQPKLFQAERGWLAAWLVQDEGVWRIETRTLSADGHGEGIRTMLPWTLPNPYFAMTMADDQMYFAWNEEGHVVVAVLFSTGDVRTPPTIVSAQNSAVPGETTLAFDQGFGVVAFAVVIEGVRREVRARLLGPDGLPMRPERVVSLAPLRGRSPSAAAFAGGYAIAYRASAPTEDPHLRLAFLHGSDGDVIDQYVLGPAPIDGSRAGVSVDADGALAVGWANADARGTAVFGARLQCAAAWLRCGVMR